MTRGPVTVDELRASVGTLAFGVALLCIAIMIDFNDLRRLDRRVDLRLSTLEGRHGYLVDAVGKLNDRLSPPEARAERATTAKRAASRMTAAPKEA